MVIDRESVTHTRKCNENDEIVFRPFSLVPRLPDITTRDWELYSVLSTQRSLGPQTAHASPIPTEFHSYWCAHYYRYLLQNALKQDVYLYKTLIYDESEPVLFYDSSVALTPFDSYAQLSNTRLIFLRTFIKLHGDAVYNNDYKRACYNNEEVRCIKYVYYSISCVYGSIIHFVPGLGFRKPGFGENGVLCLTSTFRPWCRRRRGRALQVVRGVV